MVKLENEKYSLYFFNVAASIFDTEMAIISCRGGALCRQVSAERAGKTRRGAG